MTPQTRPFVSGRSAKPIGLRTANCRASSLLDKARLFAGRNLACEICRTTSFSVPARTRPFRGETIIAGQFGHLFLISRYDFSLSAASASGCEHFTPCVQASCVFTSGSDNVTPCRHCPHQGVNSSPPVANRGGTVPLLLSGMELFLYLWRTSPFEVSIVDTRCICAHSRHNRDSVQKMGWQRMPPLPGC